MTIVERPMIAQRICLTDPWSRRKVGCLSIRLKFRGWLEGLATLHKFFFSEGLQRWVVCNNFCNTLAPNHSVILYFNLETTK